MRIRKMRYWEDILQRLGQTGQFKKTGDWKYGFKRRLSAYIYIKVMMLYSIKQKQGWVAAEIFAQ